MQMDGDLEQLPNFIEQTFANPFVTLSYFMQRVFYQALVYPEAIRPSTEVFEWIYKGTTVTNDENTWSVYADYHFTMSQPMAASTYFAE